MVRKDDHDLPEDSPACEPKTLKGHGFAFLQKRAALLKSRYAAYIGFLLPDFKIRYTGHGAHLRYKTGNASLNINRSDTGSEFRADYDYVKRFIGR